MGYYTGKLMGQIAATGGNWWNLGGTITSCVAAYQPKGASSYDNSKINLANPGTHNAVNGTAYPTWSATKGWSFNRGLSQFLSTTVMTNVGMTWIVRIANGDTVVSAGKDICVFGAARGGSPYDGMYFQSNLGNGTHQYTNGRNAAFTGAKANGIFAASGGDVYENGTDVGNLTNTGNPNVPIYLGCLRLGTSNIQYYTGDIVAIAFYSTVLTPTQIANLTTAINAL